MHTPWHGEIDFKRLVLIADERLVSENEPTRHRHDLEMSEPSVVMAILKASAELQIGTVHYQTPRELSEAADEHKSDLILSIFGGKDSRNRMCLVPAVCEVHQLQYVGPDAYGRVICQDKEVSKALAAEAGLAVPSHLTIRTSRDLKRLADIDRPYVLKPSLEGTSIGVYKENLIRRDHEGTKAAQNLLSEFNQPILAEAFVPGREVALNFIETESGLITSFTETTILDSPDYFNENLYDVETKILGDSARQIALIDNEIPTDLLKAAQLLLHMVGPLSYGRIDGKLHNGSFYFLELTPDAHLAPWGVFAQAFIKQGWQFTDVLAAILTAKRPRPRDQAAND